MRRNDYRLRSVGLLYVEECIRLLHQNPEPSWSDQTTHILSQLGLSVGLPPVSDKEAVMDAKDLEELASSEYWDKRYAQQIDAAGKAPEAEGASSYEWFRSFKQLQPFFERQLEIVLTSSSLLHLGCGDSSLPAEIYRLGYHNQTCLDFSEVVINQMKHQHTSIAADIQWIVMDVREIKLPSKSIDLAIDKGTLDAFLHGSLWDPPDDVRDNVGKYVDCVANVLKPGARWIYITYRQPHFMKPLLARENVWDIRVEKLNDDAGGFEYFAFVMTKRLT